MNRNQLSIPHLENAKIIANDSRLLPRVNRDNEQNLTLVNYPKININQRFYHYLIRQTHNYTDLTKEKGALIRLTVSFIILFRMSIEDVRKLKIANVQNIFYGKESEFYLTLFDKNVKNYIKRLARDFKILSKSISINHNTVSSTEYLFKSSYSGNKPIPRESLTRLLNKVLKDVSKKKGHKILLTTKTLAKSNLTDQLWLDPKDIEFVKRKLKS
jgi:hypothetical protein